MTGISERLTAYSEQMPSVLTSLFPQARAELLRLLFAGAGARLHMREITRQSGLTLATVQAELKKMTASGLLLQERDGNRLYYMADTAHPIFPELRSLVEKTTGLGEVLRESLESLTGIDLAFVFGSVAAQKDKAGSDVDVMVIGSASLRSLAPKLRRASELLHREINPHVMSAAEWRRRLLNEDAFVQRVSKEPKIWLKGGADELGKLG